MSDPFTTEPLPSGKEGWLDKESFGFGLIGGVLIAGVLSLVAETVFHATTLTRAAAVVLIAMGMTVWFWRKRPRRK